MSLQPPTRRAFTLIELLVVLGVIGILASLLLPALASARAAGRRAACLSNLRQIGLAIHAYAMDEDGEIPYGPKAPPFTSPSNFYPSTGAPTSLVSLRNGGPVGLGLLLADYLAAQPRVLFCPGADQRLNADAELALVGHHQAQASYYYRHAGNTLLFDDPNHPVTPEHIRLANPGNNRDGLPIQALAIDSQFLCPEELESFNVRPRTHHRRERATVLYLDGRAVSQANADGRFTVDIRDYAHLRRTFDQILAVLERADREH
ncbi:MAG: type II secretion system protein [Verrucomicrobiales bacterium]|nr:type II secretion system protein [Verrucomicrobiales bacterium]